MKEELIVSLTADIKDLKSSLDKASAELNSFASKTKTSANQINNSFSEIGNSVKNLVLGYVSLQAATSALGASFDRALKLDSINASMTAIMGSSEAAAEQFKKLSDFANQYGLNLIAVSDSYKNFSASALSANVSLEQTDYIFQSVAKAAAVLKLSNDDLKGALNAMAQMISKGTVQAEELRGQLGERLPGAFNIAAKAMGVTTAELGKMLENGEVMAGELLPKLAEELNKSFGDKIVGNVDNLQASINRLDNSFTEAVQKGNIGVFFKQIVDGANEAVKIFESSSWTEFGTRVLALATGNQFLKVQIDAVTEAQKNLNKEVSKTPKSDLTKTFGTPTKPKAAGRQFTEPLELMQGAKEQIATAKELFNLYKESPKSLGLLGEEYVSNPFFRDLINGDLKNKTDETQAAFQKFLNTKRDDTSGGGMPIDKEIEAANEQAQALVSTLGNGLTAAFEAAMTNGTSFFSELGAAILNMIKKLLAAIAVASILSAILGGFGIAASSVGKGTTLFGNILGNLTGGLLGGNGGAPGQRVSSGVTTSSNSGTVDFEIRGDKLYGVLQNYQGRLDKLV
jgi:tape measure domain-containing protein